MQEGITSEACSLAGHLGLGRLIVFYDDNKIQIDGSTDLAFTEDVMKRYEAYGWQTLHVEDGDTDLGALRRPSTRRSASSPADADQGAPPPSATARASRAPQACTARRSATPTSPRSRRCTASTRTASSPSPTTCSRRTSSARARGQAHAEWSEMFARYRKAHPELAKEFERRRSGELPEGWRDALPRLDAGGQGARDAPVVAGRPQQDLRVDPRARRGLRRPDPLQLDQVSRRARLPGGDARGALRALRRARARDGRHLQRHAAYCAGLIPFCATFLNFFGYAAGAVVSLCKLADLKIKVVSFPCWELFEQQSTEYKHSIFPAGIPVLAVEALSVEGWQKYAHSCVGMNTFGASAPGKDLANRFGFTADNVASRAKELLAFYKGKTVPHLLTIGPTLPVAVPHSGHGKYAA